MNFQYELRKRLRHAAIPVLCACAAAYFGYHAVQGDHGLIIYLRYGQYIEALETKRDVIRAERQTIEHRVAQLRPQSLDPDLLDERARAVLGFAHPNERVIFIEPDAPSAPAK